MLGPGRGLQLANHPTRTNLARHRLEGQNRDSNADPTLEPIVFLSLVSCLGRHAHPKADVRADLRQAGRTWVGAVDVGKGSPGVERIRGMPTPGGVHPFVCSASFYLSTCCMQALRGQWRQKQDAVLHMVTSQSNCQEARCLTPARHR